MTLLCSKLESGDTSQVVSQLCMRGLTSLCKAVSENKAGHLCIVPWLLERLLKIWENVDGPYELRISALALLVEDPCNGFLFHVHPAHPLHTLARRSLRVSYEAAPSHAGGYRNGGG